MFHFANRQFKMMGRNIRGNTSIFKGIKAPPPQHISRDMPIVVFILYWIIYSSLKRGDVMSKDLTTNINEKFSFFF